VVGNFPVSVVGEDLCHHPFVCPICVVVSVKVKREVEGVMYPIRGFTRRSCRRPTRRIEAQVFRTLKLVIDPCPGCCFPPVFDYPVPFWT